MHLPFDWPLHSSIRHITRGFCSPLATVNLLEDVLWASVSYKVGFEGEGGEIWILKVTTVDCCGCVLCVWCNIWLVVVCLPLVHVPICNPLATSCVTFGWRCCSLAHNSLQLHWPEDSVQRNWWALTVLLWCRRKGGCSEELGKATAPCFSSSLTSLLMLVYFVRWLSYTLQSVRTACSRCSVPASVLEKIKSWRETRFLHPFIVSSDLLFIIYSSVRCASLFGSSTWRSLPKMLIF